MWVSIISLHKGLGEDTRSWIHDNSTLTRKNKVAQANFPPTLIGLSSVGMPLEENRTNESWKHILTNQTITQNQFHDPLDLIYD